MYCIPEDTCSLPNEQLLSKAEIISVAKTFVNNYGVKKIRLTGGEPLVRSDAREIFEELSHLPVELAITTNGILLDRYVDFFESIGMRSINISLDTLNEGRFTNITKSPAIEKVKSNIDLLLKKNFSLKINNVVMRGVNDDEIIDFVRMTKDLPLHVRFIEFMPFNGNNWYTDDVFSYNEIIERIHNSYSIEKLDDHPNSTSKSYKAKGYEGTFSVISSITAPFCDSCNRLRVTADGKFRNCLFAKGEIDLLSALRQGVDITKLIHDEVTEKAYMHGGMQQLSDDKDISSRISDRSMLQIGG